jgi:pimeloyl-ACP methyl ester carboxylesterase
VFKSPLGRRALRKRSHALIAAPAIAAAALLAGALPAAVAGAASVTPGSGRAAAAGVDLQVHRCSSKPLIVCGTFTVPLDRSDPAAGSVRLFFERYLHTDLSQPALEPIVAVEGGPGYATTGTASAYAALFAPLMSRRDLLLMDLPGTGRSQAIDCPALQAGSGSLVADVAACGAQLGATANDWGSANAADDLSELLNALGIKKIDLYGDSYGTFFVQTFAVRHPDQLRTIVMDSPYPAYGEDPWGRDTNVALDEAFRLACARSASCAALGGDVMSRLVSLAGYLTHHPVKGIGYDADGHPHHVVANLANLLALMTSGPTNLDVYRELDAAGRALMQGGDSVPLLRLLAEEVPLWANGPYREFSAGLYTAVACHDYPQLYDMTAPPALRAGEYGAAVRQLEATDPGAFAPFTVAQWVGSGVEGFNYCLRWPARPTLDPPVGAGARYPDVPALVLAGDLDSLTSSAGARIVASRFPDSTFVELANSGHVNALDDLYDCASAIVVRFVATGVAGNTSCAPRLPAIRLVNSFAETVAGVVPAVPAGRGDRSTPYDRHVAAAAAETVADALARWPNMTGDDGVGLRGGTFTVTGSPLVRFALHSDRWVENLPVGGRAIWDQLTGLVSALVLVPGGRLSMSWSNDVTGGEASITGRLDGRPISLVMPAP